MILLDVVRGTSVTKGGKIPLESMELTLKERESTARIVPVRMDGITTESWMRDDTTPGSDMVWRVRSIEQDYGSNTPTVQLEHVINLLRDTVITEEITPETITGTEGATTCTAQQAINYLLGLQHAEDWTLFSFGYPNVTGGYKFSSGSLYDAIIKVTETLESPEWTYDTTKYPFRLRINPKSTGVTSALRPGRNLVSLTKTIDRSGMYTRFYPVGADDLRVTGGYVSLNENLYGVISHTEVDQSLTTEAELIAWANERLSKHAHPNVTITADGLELQTALGVSQDHMGLGHICRIPLEEFGEEFEERIVELYYPDKINQREVVRVTLANAQEDVTRIIADAIKHGSSGSAGMTSTRRSAADHAWIEDTDEYVALVAEKTGINSLGQQETLYGKIQVEAGKISQIVSAVGENGEVTAASIVLAINSSTGQSIVTIDADHIKIGNSDAETVINGKCSLSDVTATYINSQFANAASFSCIGINATGNIITSSGVMASQVYVGSGSSWTNISDGIAAVQVSGPSNNVYTLQYKKFSDSSWQSAGTFSRAASTLISGSWSGNVYTAITDPNGSTEATTTVTVSYGPGTSAATAAQTASISTFSSKKAYAMVVGSGTTGTNLWKINIDATSVYNAGLSDYYNSNYWSSTLSWNNNTSKWRVGVPNIDNDATEDWNITIPFVAYNSGYPIKLYYVDGYGMYHLAYQETVWYHT